MAGVPILARRLGAECLGTLLLVAAVVGSGIMADRLTDDVALALLANTLSTAAALVVLITLLGPVSGAHFNPVVSLALVAEGRQRLPEAVAYITAQLAGGTMGTVLANGMFSLPPTGATAAVRSGAGLWLSEAVATFLLVLVILGALRHAAARIPVLVGLTIASAYWFTASTSFANPAVTVARTLTDSFAGIRMLDVPAFVLAQLAGATVAVLLARLLFGPMAPVRSSG